MTANILAVTKPDLTAKSQTKWKKEHKELFFDSLNYNASLDMNNRLTEFASSDLQGIDQEKLILWFLTVIKLC